LTEFQLDYAPVNVLKLRSKKTGFSVVVGQTKTPIVSPISKPDQQTRVCVVAHLMLPCRLRPTATSSSALKSSMIAVVLILLNIWSS